MFWLPLQSDIVVTYVGPVSDMYLKHDTCNDGTNQSISLQDFESVGHHISAQFMLLQAELHERIIALRCSWC